MPVVRPEPGPAMSERFFNDPILNSPYERPSRHWELVKGIPTQVELAGRRESQLITPIPKPRKRGGKDEQRELEFGAQGLSDSDQQYEVTQQINSIRALVEEWRQAPESQWKVTAIWFTEVAPESDNYYAGASEMNESNDRLNRLMP